MSERLQPAIWGGLFIGVLSALPFVNLPNYCCCCLWVLVGGALAIAGATFQALLRNPLAEPYTLGVSSGAAVGAVLTVVTGWSIRTVWALPRHGDRSPRLDLAIGAVGVEEGHRRDGIRALTVRGVPRLLRRAIRNLLENARRYGAGEVSLHLEAEGPQARVVVSDRGPGVPPALRDRIFEPFYRLPGASEREGGVGLGLALVKSIAERHGGSISASDRPGGGARFEVRLPASA